MNEHQSKREQLAKQFEKRARGMPLKMQGADMISFSQIKRWAIGNDFRAKAAMILHLPTGYPNLKIPSED